MVFWAFDRLGTNVSERPIVSSSGYTGKPCRKGTTRYGEVGGNTSGLHGSQYEMLSIKGKTGFRDERGGWLGPWHTSDIMRYEY